MYRLQILDEVKLSTAMGKLRRFRIPFVILLVLCFMLEIAQSLGRALDADTGVLLTITSLFYVTVQFCASIFYFIIGGRLVKRLSGRNTHTRKVNSILV